MTPRQPSTTWYRRESVSLVTLADVPKITIYPWTPAPILRRDQVTPQMRVRYRAVAAVFGPGTKVLLDGQLCRIVGVD